MATEFQHRQLKRALNNVFARYDLHQPHIPITGEWTGHAAEESKWAQWVCLGMPDHKIGSYGIDFLTQALNHPGVYFLTRRDNLRRHRARLAQVRHPTQGPHELTHFEGITVAAWVPPILEHVRSTGQWRGATDGDQLQGWRGPVGSGLQSYLWKRYLAGVERGPVAEPGTSMHEYCACSWCRAHLGSKGGAIDVSDASDAEHGDLRWAGGGDPPHLSSREHYNATGRY